MRNIEDYIGKKYAIRCQNKEQWNELQKCLGNENLVGNYKPPYDCVMLDDTTNAFRRGTGYHDIYTVLSFSDFFPLKPDVEETPETPEIPELVGVEMEVSDDGVSWDIRKVYCNTPDGYIYMNIFNKLGFVKYARPIQPKAIELTLEEATTKLTEMLGVDKVTIKNK